MRNRTVWIAVLAAVSSFTANPVAASNFAAIERIPGATPVTVLVADKPRVYFRLTSNAPLSVPVDGPARVRVVSRVECPPSGVVTYRLVASEGGRTLDHPDTESSASSGVRLERGDTPLGKSRRGSFDVPEGRHMIALSLSGAPAALVRVQSSTGGGPEAMVSLTPIVADRSVNVAEGEKLIPYYTVATGRPIRLRVIGPTTLELSTRLDFDATMRGIQNYRLRLSEGTRTLRDLDLKTTKAIAASYENVRDRVPSKLGVSRIPVPDGTHEITIALLLPARGAAQVHARIPEPSVGNEE